MCGHFSFSLFSPFPPWSTQSVVIFLFAWIVGGGARVGGFRLPTSLRLGGGTTKKNDNSHGGTEFQHSTGFAVGFGLDGLGVNCNPIYLSRKKKHYFWILEIWSYMAWSMIYVERWQLCRMILMMIMMICQDHPVEDNAHFKESSRPSRKDSINAWLKGTTFLLYYANSEPQWKRSWLRIWPKLNHHEPS